MSKNAEKVEIVETVEKTEEEQPNKGYSFIIGIVIGMAIIILFAILFPR